MKRSTADYDTRKGFWDISVSVFHEEKVTPYPEPKAATLQKKILDYLNSPSAFLKRRNVLGTIFSVQATSQVNVGFGPVLPDETGEMARSYDGTIDIVERHYVVGKILPIEAALRQTASGKGGAFEKIDLPAALANGWTYLVKNRGFSNVDLNGQWEPAHLKGLVVVDWDSKFPLLWVPSRNNPGAQRAITDPAILAKLTM